MKDEETRETQKVSLWFNNDEGLYNMATELADECFADDGENAITSLAEQLQHFFEENCPVTENGPYMDLMNYSMAQIDWESIAEGFIEVAKGAANETV